MLDLESVSGARFGEMGKTGPKTGQQNRAGLPAGSGRGSVSGCVQIRRLMGETGPKTGPRFEIRFSPPQLFSARFREFMKRIRFGLILFLFMHEI